jgi:serine/threonine protein kinase/tetratricopeptide (TPR) repeat protein
VKPDERAAEIVLQLRERIARGESVDAEQAIRAHPELAAALRRQLDAVRRIERAYPRRDAVTQLAQVGCDVGPYRLVRQLGSGGMGTVFLAERPDAWDREDRPQDGPLRPRSVAVKILHPHLVARPGHLERFLREADVGRRVRHPNVVATLDAGATEIDGRAVHYLVLEYVEGRTLRALAADLGRLPEDLCRHLGREVAKGLAAIHAAGAVHRDLKPDNVIVTQDHAVKVMDFGVARIADGAPALSQAGAFVGSIHYGSPEQFTDAASVDARADIHALGLTLYELATGVHPFAGDDVRAVMRSVLDAMPRRCGELNPQLSPLFEELVAQLLEKNRDKRPASAREVARILDEGEESAWWRERARTIRAHTKRPLRRIRIPRETALYGRDAELARLRALFDRATVGDGQVAVIEGEAGIGKSRLVDEFVGSLAQAGADVNFLYGSYPPGGAATASGAFTSAYREHLGDDDSAIRAALPQTPLLVPAFAALLRGDVAPEGAEKLTKDSLQTVFVHATRSFAASRPTVVLIDDLHFAPEEGRALFASLALAVPGHRILLVGTARPEINASWAAQIDRLEQASHLRLSRLGAKDLVLLLRDSLRSEHLAQELAAQIAVKSDGNPFFVFEILRGLREGQFLTRRPDGAWITTQSIREIQVPSSVVELVQARISVLGLDDRNALEVAACVGFEFDSALVASALGMPRIPLLQRLGQIEKAHRLVRSSGRRFVFDHHQIQETLYAGISEPLREEYHAAIGAAIEAQSGAASKEPKDVDGAVCVELAEHSLAGAKGERALRYLDAALTHLERNYFNDGAARLADLALAAPGLLMGTRRCEVLLLKGQALFVLGHRDEQLRCLAEANSLADAAGDAVLRAKARKALGWFLKHVGRWTEARATLEEAISLAKESGDRRVEADATCSLGNVLNGLAKYDDARMCIERSLAMSQEIGDRMIEANATGNLGAGFKQVGRYDEARSLFERHAAISRDIGDRLGEAIATGNLGGVAYALSRYDEARDLHERRLAMSRAIGDRSGEAIATGGLAGVLYDVGRYAEALSYFERRLAISREIGDRHGEAIALVNLGPVRLALGDAVGAREALTESLAICRTIGAQYPEGYALHGLGAVAEAEDELIAALRLHGEALDLRRAIRHADGIVESLLAIGELRRRSGDPSRARAAAAEAAALAEARGFTSEVVVARAILACLPEGDADAAVAEHARFVAQGDSSRVRLLLWHATGDLVHLAEAKRLLDHIIAQAPPEYRESMVANVPLHREIAEAARAHGLG